MSSPATEYESSGSSVAWLFSLLTVLVLGMGVLAYYNYAKTEDRFVEAFAIMDTRGPGLDVEGCIDAVLEWNADCGGNQELCDHGIPVVLTHCLKGRPRTATCEGFRELSADAKWAFAKCADRGTPCRSKKKCPCAAAYRGLHSYCVHHEEGVAL